MGVGSRENEEKLETEGRQFFKECYCKGRER